MAQGYGVNGEDRNTRRFAASVAQQAHAEAMRSYNQQREAALEQAKIDTGAAVVV